MVKNQGLPVFLFMAWGAGLAELVGMGGIKMMAAGAGGFQLFLRKVFLMAKFAGGFFVFFF